MRDDDDRPKPKASHELGADLSAISVAELAERIGLLEAEIVRLREEVARKEASRDAAGAFFKL
jgi:uncharacterized small protein (DUF1192 family)